MSDEPTCFSFRELPADGSTREAIDDIVIALRGAGAKYIRMTLVDDVDPIDGYPHGIYGEGWARPHPNVGPFNYPLTAR